MKKWGKNPLNFVLSPFNGPSSESVHELEGPSSSDVFLRPSITNDHCLWSGTVYDVDGPPVRSSTSVHLAETVSLKVYDRDWNFTIIHVFVRGGLVRGRHFDRISEVGLDEGRRRRAVSSVELSILWLSVVGIFLTDLPAVGIMSGFFVRRLSVRILSV